MSADRKDLQDILDELADASEHTDKFSIEEIRETVGHRSFAPLLVALGLIVITPVGGIPGVPSLFGLTVILLTGQILIGRDHLWLPQVILRRSVNGEKFRRGIGKIRPAAVWTDKFIRPRLTFLSRGAARYAVATACCLLGVALPPLELVPFAAAVPAATITLFGLSLMANDGVLVLLGYVSCLGTVYVIATTAPFDAVF